MKSNPNMPTIPTVIPNPWEHLKQFTEARIALGRAGGSIPTQNQLEFQLAHALARDAVKTPLNWQTIRAELAKMKLQWLQVYSQATDRLSYLQRPDLGRQLNIEDKEKLEAVKERADIAIVIADGLSSQAIQENAIGMLSELLPGIKPSYSIGAIILAEQARVALGDEIGLALGVKMVVMLIGERPGLSAANSMGIYLTYKPKIGCLDSARNCLSNIREGGMTYETAAEKTVYLIEKAFSKQLTGVGLKEEQNTLEHHLESEKIVRKMLGKNNPT